MEKSFNIVPDAYHLLTDEENLPRAFPEFDRPIGAIKSLPEDFVVEEIPAYLPSGEGDFTYLWVEKRGLDTATLLKRIANILEIDAKEIGHAGIKDKVAITRQFLSIPAEKEPLVDKINELDGVRVLSTQRHEHRLRNGKLRGNRFDILVRTESYSMDSLEEIAARIRENGIPNFYGGQRFGHRGQSAVLGWALLLGESSKRVQKVRRNRFMKKLALSAAQALIFNHYVHARIQAGTLREVLETDILQKVESGGLFSSEDTQEEMKRLLAQEIVPTGPIPGRKDRWSQAPARPLEQTSIQDSGIPTEAYSGFGKLALGSRRGLIVFPQELSLVSDENGFRVRFVLRSGSYATLLMREFHKTMESESTESTESTLSPQSKTL